MFGMFLLFYTKVQGDPTARSVNRHLPHTEFFLLERSLSLIPASSVWQPREMMLSAHVRGTTSQLRAFLLAAPGRGPTRCSRHWGTSDDPACKPLSSERRTANKRTRGDTVRQWGYVPRRTVSLRRGWRRVGATPWRKQAVTGCASGRGQDSSAAEGRVRK